MYLITSNTDNIILAIAESVSYQQNGYPIADDIAYYNASVEEVESVPEGVTPYDWAYTDGEFAQIVIPEPVEDELSDAITALETLGYVEVEDGQV